MTLTGNDLSPVANILGTQIADYTITARNIAPQTIINTHIVNQTITATQILDATITGAKIAALSITAGNIEAGTITGDKIAANTITGTNIEALNITGKSLVADTGIIGGWTLSNNTLVGPAGAIIRSGQTDFDVGTGFWIGNVNGTPKFSFGVSGGDSAAWDGSNLRITGALTPTTVFTTYSYTTANLPQPPTTVGFSNPSANE